MKISSNKYGTYLLYSDDGLFSGASVRSCFSGTDILFYSDNADYDDIKAIDDINKWVELKRGFRHDTGWSTKTQYWKQWKIPIKIGLLIKDE